MLNIRQSANIGMTVRTACVLGCKEFIICGRKQYDKRFTVGAEHYIPTTYWHEPLKVTINCVPQKQQQSSQSPRSPQYEDVLIYNADDFAEKCTASSWTPVFVEQGGQNICDTHWRQIDNPLLIFGNESYGIPCDFMAAVKKRIPSTRIVSIPQWSILRSMNVSMAACIAMWEVSKTRQSPI
jgi:tRNA(Leu) C34 or U34 (ribose-2'-O)-methylase TrmL